MLQKFIESLDFNESNIYEYLFETISFGITFRDIESKIIFANPAALDILGLSIQELQGRSALDPRWKAIKEDGTEFPGEEHPSVLALKTGQKIADTIMGIFNPKIGNTRWINVQAIPLKRKENQEIFGVYTSFEDITSKKRMEDIEKEKSDQLKRLNADMSQRQFAIDQHSIVAVTDFDGIISHVNEKFCKISKFTRDELLGENHRIINSGYHSKFFFRVMYQTIYSGNTWHGEFRNKAKDGTLYWVNATIVPLKDINGKIKEFYSIRTDITEQKRLQEDYRSSEAKIRALFDNYPQAVVFLDKEKRIQFFNQIASEKYKSYFGNYLLLGESILTYILESEHKSFELHFNQALNGKIIQFERVFNVLGKDHWIDLQYVPIINDQQTCIGVLFIANDVTERKNTEQITLQNELKFRTIFEQAPMGISLVDSSNHIINQINSQFCLILGYEKSALLNKNYKEIIFPEDLEIFEEKMRLLETGKIQAFTMEKRFIKKDGSIIWTHLTCAPLWKLGDDVKLNLKIITDITGRKLLEETNLQYTKGLESLNNSKDKFFSIIAHDLKNPFSGIIGISEVLEEELSESNDSIAPEALRYIRMIQTASKSAFSLLENLMQWARSQTGDISLNLSNLSIRKAIDSILPLVEGSSFKKNISILVNVDEGELVYADYSLLSTVLRNLLTNSIKFSYPDGQITISTKKHDSFIEISIADTGVGIDPKNLSKIFRIDSKFSNPGTSNEKGTGLGLILCKEFVELQGGKIWAESQLGIGSTFLFSLPIGKN